MLWLQRTLTSLGSTLHKMEPMVVICQAVQCWALETKQKIRQLWSLPLRGSQSRKRSKADRRPGIDHAGR